MEVQQRLQEQRLANWRQTASTRIAGPAEAPALIDRVGVATLYPVSPEVPNLYHAYIGDATASTQSTWDSPSGEVYGWRWTLGRQGVAFYSAVVRGRPTWVSWPLLPAMLRLRGELRSPAELYSAGQLSAAAHRVAEALDRAGGVLSTADLRREAGFPTGKEQRAAYLKAIDELDTRLLLAKVFAPDDADTDMRHALVRVLYAGPVGAAEGLTRDYAYAALLTAYLPWAVYALPAVLARHLKLPEAELRAGLERLVADGRAARAALPGVKGHCYLWTATATGA